jgi:hypothetical protein
VEPKDYLSVGLSFAALATTIIWNIANRRHTDRTATRIRGESFAFDEWKGRRAEVLRTLRELEAGFARLKALSKGAHQHKDLQDEIEKEGRALTVSHQALLSELDRANPGWSSFGYGVVSGGESDWDQVHTILDDARQQSEPSAMRARLALLDGNAKSISDVIIAELRVATAEHDPIKL